jgi:PAS domain S-box-containing protein
MTGVNGDAYLEQDDELRLVAWSPEAERLFGWSAAEAIGASSNMLIPGRNHWRNEETVRTLLTSGDPQGSYSRQITVLHKDGREFTAEFSTRIIQRDGELFLAATARRVSAPQLGAEAFAPNDARYRNILDQIEDGCTVVDLRGRYLFVNEAFCRMFGRRREDLLGKSFKTTTDPERARHIQGIYEEIHRTGVAVKAFDYHIGSSDRHYEQSVSLERDAEGRSIGFLAIIRDCTDRKRAEQALAKAKEEAEAANRSKSEFLANMSHEIRTPMNGIIGMTELVLDTDLTAYQRDGLNTVKSSAESLLTILNDILDFSKIESRKLELESVPFGVAEVVAETLKPLAVRADQKGIELIADIAADVPQSIVGDPVRLKQVLTNLVGNALKFTDKGHVILQVGLARAGIGCARLSFSVTDTGVGIAPDKLSTIFEPFRQADGSTTRRFGGTGLGLSISSTIVRMMGGSLAVESTPGEGSTFAFTAAFDTVDAANRTRGVPGHLPGRRVLVVDDNQVNRRIFEEQVAGWGMQATSVASGQAAIHELEAAFRHGQPFSLVLLDANMPGMDGFGVAERIARNRDLAGATVMLLTSSGEYGDVARCKELGISAYLTKPLRRTDLYDAICRLLNVTATAEPIRGPRTPLTAEGVKPLDILLAEDNVVNQRVAVGLLTKRGHRVHVSVNGFEALEALERGRFDVVLMDVQMPEMGGLEATMAIRKREEGTGRRQRIVAMTAHAMNGDRERCLNAGMDGYLSKPIDPQMLFAVVEQSADAPQPTPSPVPGAVNREEMLERLGGDQALFDDVVALFLEDCPVRLAAIKAAVEARDREEIRQTAHALKGAAGNLAAGGLFEAAKVLERLGAEGRFDAAEGAWRRLSAEASAVLDQLRRFESRKGIELPS